MTTRENKMIRRLAAQILAAGLLVAAAFLPQAASALTPWTPGAYSDLWWNASQSGWGVSINHHAQTDRIYMAWFAYDNDGHPLWVVMIDGRRQAGNTYAGDLFTTTGPDPRVAFDSRDVRVNLSGYASITFRDDGKAVIDYTLLGVQGRREIQRQVFGAPVARLPLPQKALTDLYWNQRESGYGVSVHQQGDKLFAVWFSYDAQNRPIWYVMPDGEWSTNYFKYTGPLYVTATNPNAFFAEPAFDTSSVTVRPVGTMSFFLRSETQLEMTYEINGVSGVKQLTRQPF